ncbi:MAG TPA: S-layer homology domain-containing protein [Firmicutes bacterium]|nr:S-layer homology domain-containing protein [Bacillota bacterium]
MGGPGLMTGTDEGRIDPQGNATRAEAATILQRFLAS